MLHYNTVEPRTQFVLNSLMQIPELKSFSLVGGTALSLYFGHRISIDLDLFSVEKFDHLIIEEALVKQFGNTFQYEPTTNKHFGIFCFIENIKVDIVKIPQALLYNSDVIDGIRMYNVKDIAAMKIQAILGRAKKKDFWDLAEILKTHKLNDVIEWHKQKYPNQLLAISIPNAISYFDEADESEDPISLKGQTWESIKQELRIVVGEFLK